MPETRLQSDMIQNMGRGAAAAMFQRNQILANQQEWLDYVQARDGGAFQPSYSGGYLHEEYLPGQQKHYARMQRDALEHRRRVVLQQMAMQRQMAVQQHQFMLDQQQEEMEIRRSQEEADRQILEIRKTKDEVRKRKDLTQGQRDKIVADLDRKEYGLTGESEPLVKKVQRDSPFFYPPDYPNEELRNKPIQETYQVNTETGEETLLGSSGENVFNSLTAHTEKNRRFNFDQQKEENSKKQKEAELKAKQAALDATAEKEEKEKQPRVLTREEERAGKGVYIGDEAKKTLNEESSQYAHQQYKDKMIKTLGPNHPDIQEYTSESPDRKKAIEEKWDAEVDRQIDAGSGEAWDLFDQHRQKKLPLDFGYNIQDTGEMFAAQDPGMMEQPLTDPGMEFDPADDAYIMDEEFV